tara:strand:+ start:295 stop:411 length:117 start_codon:yes stop_codon:yes gene_type:complete
MMAGLEVGLAVPSLVIEEMLPGVKAGSSADPGPDAEFA